MKTFKNKNKNSKKRMYKSRLYGGMRRMSPAMTQQMINEARNAAVSDALPPSSKTNNLNALKTELRRCKAELKKCKSDLQALQAKTQNRDSQSQIYLTSPNISR